MQPLFNAHTQSTHELCLNLNQSLGFGGHPKINIIAKICMKPTSLSVDYLLVVRSKQLSWSHMNCLSSSFGVLSKVLGLEWGI